MTRRGCGIRWGHRRPVWPAKCLGSDPIYLLEDGQKCWIDTIETFEARGYVWGDVQFVSCEDLNAIPDGAPIPADAR
jgi:hypothetical protein